MPTIFNRYSTAGFYKAPVSKALLGSVVISHVSLQLPMFHSVHKYFICKFPESFLKGEAWRLVTSKLTFIDTKDAIFITLLIYYFRIFERRLGSRKFSSQFLATFLLSSALEVLLSSALTTYVGPNGFSGLLAVGPIGAVFPWFIAYHQDVPTLSSSTFGGFAVSTKSLTYLLGLQVLGGSLSNGVAGVSALIAAGVYRLNLLGLSSWCNVPEKVAAIADCVFGWLVSSGAGPVDSGVGLGATLEIQRAQQMEALEQQMIRAQTRQAQRGGGNIMAAHRQRLVPAGGVGRAQVAQGFAERLVDDAVWGGLGGGGDARGGADAAQPQQEHQEASPPPTESNVRLLTDMGFSRERVVDALRRANDDVQTATNFLVQQVM